MERIDPWAKLLHAIVNAILYAGSAGVEPVPRQPRRSPPSGVPADSDGGGLYYLPGKISISHLRNYEAIERGQRGGQLMHRFMVRGHWRRANPNWKDQRMRWIEPYWKGPDLATIIEHTCTPLLGEQLAARRCRRARQAANGSAPMRAGQRRPSPVGQV